MCKHLPAVELQEPEHGERVSGLDGLGCDVLSHQTLTWTGECRKMLGPRAEVPQPMSRTWGGVAVRCKRGRMESRTESNAKNHSKFLKSLLLFSV